MRWIVSYQKHLRSSQQHFGSVKVDADTEAGARAEGFRHASQQPVPPGDELLGATITEVRASPLDALVPPSMDGQDKGGIPT